ncbi:MAG TPA: GGDEF domain-containing protein [Candidatus Eisenbergiella stercoravium]|nr:GGDEF domain-containing protein [Candidatus Eisenbergiella stercoravium]
MIKRERGAVRRVWQMFTAFCSRNRTYFSNNQQQVAENNLRMLWAALWVLLVFLAVYGVWTTSTIRYLPLAVCYVVICAIVSALLLVTHFFRNHRPKPWLIQASCMACVCTLMGFVIVISVFPFPQDPAIFYPLGYIVVASLFNFSYQRIMLLMSVISIVYLIIVNMFRPPEMIYLDQFSGVTTWIVTSLFLLLLSDLRLRNGETLLLLEKVSQTDSLTGLPNRRGAHVYMSTSFSHCQQKGLPIAAMMIDVDHFKEYNDLLGHQAGDSCLVSIGQILQDFSRKYSLLASRYGGEEFLILLPDVAEKDARQLSEELLERVRQQAITTPNGIVTISIGTAVCCPGQEDTISDLIHQADEALYRSKANGRNQATIVVQPAPPFQSQRM